MECSAPPVEPPSCSVCGEAAVSRCDECSPDGKLLICGRAECFGKTHNAFIAAKHQQLLVPWHSRKKWTPQCCATHTQKALEYWCDVCRVPVCDKCCSHGEHVGHATSLIPDVCHALQQGLQEKAEQLDAGVERASERLAQLVRLRDEAGRREGSVGAAMRALDEAEKQFGDKMRALRAELEASAALWHDRAAGEHEELARRMASVRALAEKMRASCNEEEEEAQRVAVGYNEQCKQQEVLRVPLPSLVGCEVGVPPDALAALQAAVAGLALASEGVVSCATCTQEGCESSMQVCGCKQKVCSAVCVAACLACVKAERDALPEASQYEVVLPENVTPEVHFAIAADACSMIAEVWRGVDNPDAALRLLHKARVIREDKAPGSLELANTYHGLGRVQDNDNAAQTWHEKARVIREDKAPGSLELANTYDCLGWVFYDQENYNAAQTWHEKARVIREDKAPDSLELASTYHGLGWVFYDQENYNAAQTWHEKARVIREDKAPDSLELANTYDCLGWVFYNQENYNAAQTWHEKARVIREDKAPDSLELASTYHGLGWVFYDQENYNAAQTWHEKARVIREDKAPGSLELASTYHGLGWVFYDQENDNAAQTWHEKARVIREDKAPGSLELANTYDGLGWVFYSQENYNAAQTWHEKARVIREDKAPGSLELASTYDCLGRVSVEGWGAKARVIRAELQKRG